MPRYSEEIINEVFAENDIVDYVSKYVLLKRSGKDYSGLCPFHGEKSPSFHVNREKQLFHCFGCGAGGNLIQFVMRIEGLDFVEALKLLADRAGIILPEDNGVRDDIIHEKKQRIYAMNKLAARFYYRTLVKNDVGKEALKYLTERQILPKTITAYGMGFAPDNSTALCEFLEKEGYNKKEIAEAGLANEREGKVWDKFRNRVMFPIIDLRGNIIGFGGRIMGQAHEVNGYKIPKYLNSPETLVFNKGKNLFSLNYAKKDDSGRIVLCEGYMDVISVYQAGVTNICATLGTAVTPEQVKLLMRYCSEILLCYDSDEAGEKATIRAIEVINNAGARARVIRLKGAKDPDEYIKKNGIAAFRKAVAEAMPSTEYRISRVHSKYNTDTPEGKIKFISEAAKTLLSIQSDIEVDAYIKKMAEETGIRGEAIYGEYKKQKGNEAHFNGNITPQTPTIVIAEDNNTAEKPTQPTKTESLLLNLMIKDKKYIDMVKAEINPEDFSTDVSKRLLEIIYDLRQRDKVPEASVIISEFDGELSKIAANIFFNSEVYSDEEKTIRELIKDFKKKRIKNEINKTEDPVKLKALFEELQALGN